MSAEKNLVQSRVLHGKADSQSCSAPKLKCLKSWRIQIRQVNLADQEPGSGKLRYIERHER